MTTDLQVHKKEMLTRCIELDLEPQVLCDGRLDSEIVIIAEAPGSNEVQQKLPLIGPSGSLLWNVLRQNNIFRPSCYITNVSKRQISLSSEKRAQVPADEWTRWRTLLDWELSQLTKPKIILAMGNIAIEAMLGLSGIGKYRGSVFEETISGHDVKVLATYNAAAVIRNPKDEIVLQFDIRRFAQLIKGDWEPWPVETKYDLSFDQIMAEISRFKSQNRDTAVDIEWTSKRLACVGLANDVHSATCINFRDNLANRFTADEELKIMFALQDLYESLYASGHMIGQNGCFDSHASGIFDHINMPMNHDTLLMHHTLYPSLPHNLGFLTSMYTTMPYYKDEGDEWREEGDITILWNYNGKDACATLAAKQSMEKELQSQGLWNFYTSHVMRLQPHLVQSTIHGIPVDQSVKLQIATDMAKDVDAKLNLFQYRARLAAGLPETYKPNPDSPKQIKELFYDRLGLRHRSGSTDATARDAMLGDPRTSAEAKEVIVAYNDYKADSKFLSTYAESRVDPDGRFRCDWKQYGVASAPGRLSSSKTLWGTGMNMQNQPPKARQFYVADDDCVLIYFDLSQAEARVVGYVADIEKWKEDFERARQTGDYDCHRALAADMFKVPYEQVPKSDRNDDDTEYTIRYIAKRCRHGLNYRMQIHRLAETTGLPFGRAAQAYHAYHTINPEIQKWWRETERIARADRALYNAFGRRLKILQRIDDEALKSIVAFYPQSTIGDKVCRVWYSAQEDDRWDSHRARITLNIHDALIGIAHRDYAKTALSIMKAYAEQPILIENVYKTKREELIIPADVAISTLDIKNKKGEIIRRDTKHRWSNLEKVKLDAAPLVA